MTPTRQRAIARTMAWSGATIVLVCTVALTADYAVARTSASRDAERIAALQLQSQTDATASVTLAAEQDRITRTREARKARANALSIALLSAAVLFVAGAKWVVALNGRLREIAIGESAVFVDLYQALVSNVVTYIGVDGLHPTEIGYQRIAEAFFTAIQGALENR